MQRAEIMERHVDVYMGYSVEGIEEKGVGKLGTVPSAEVAAAWSSPSLRAAGGGQSVLALLNVSHLREDVAFLHRSFPGSKDTDAPGPRGPKRGLAGEEAFKGPDPDTER